jgi:hypothetical protein
MKKFMTMMLGLSLVIGTATFAFGADDTKDKDKKETKKKGGKKKKGDDKAPADSKQK